MCFYWLRDKKAQVNFDFCCAKSKENHADSWGKHYPAYYHRVICSLNVVDKVTGSLSYLSSVVMTALQGCIRGCLVHDTM